MTTTKEIGGGFFECRGEDCVGVGASPEEAHIVWLMTQQHLDMI
jgi:hypothetical protein